MPSPSSKPVRFREIAAKANCTVATVSMALNDSSRLPESTRTRIKEIARNLGYVPNQLAKSLSLGRTGVLGVVMPIAIDPYYAAILDELNQVASDRGYQLLFQFHRWSPDGEDKALRWLAESRVDGIMLYPARSSYEGAEMQQWLAGMKMPLVLLSELGGNGLSTLAGRIIKDRKQECMLARDELMRMGHRRIDILHPHFDNSATAGRYAALLDRSEPCNAELDVRIFSPRHETTDARDLAARFGLSPTEDKRLFERYITSYLDWPERGSAVITSNNRVAWHLLSMGRARGLRYPEDISIVSIGILGAGDAGGFPLTAVEYDSKEIAQSAFDIMLRQINRNERSGDIYVNAQLIRRESVGKTPTGFPAPSEKRTRKNNPSPQITP